MDTKEQTFRSQLGLNIRVARTRKRLTQEKLAELTNISEKHLTKIENGQVTTNIYYVYKIAQVLDVTVETLLED